MNIAYEENSLLTENADKCWGALTGIVNTIF